MGYNPSYKWINPTYPIYNWGHNPLTKWDEPPSTGLVLLVEAFGPCIETFGETKPSSAACSDANDLEDPCRVTTTQPLHHRHPPGKKNTSDLTTSQRLAFFSDHGISKRMAV